MNRLITTLIGTIVTAGTLVAAPSASADPYCPDYVTDKKTQCIPYDQLTHEMAIEALHEADRTYARTVSNFSAQYYDIASQVSYWERLSTFWEKKHTETAAALVDTSEELRAAERRIVRKNGTIARLRAKLAAARG